MTSISVGELIESGLGHLLLGEMSHHELRLGCLPARAVAKETSNLLLIRGLTP